MTTSPAIIEHMEHSKNPFERIHWQTCSLYWEYEIDLEELYETGKQCNEVGAQLLEACEEAYRNEFGLPPDTIMKLYAAIAKARGDA